MVRKKGLPEWGSLVICTVYRITPFAAWCKLDEYPEVEGLIHASEVAGRWVYDIKDVVKVNKKYVAKVIRIDYQKKVVNLSLKRVSKRDEKEKWDEFRKEERAERILERAASKLKKSLDEAYEEVGFSLQKKFGDLFTAFKKIRKSEKLLEKNVPKEWVKPLDEAIKESFKEKEVIIKAEIKLISFDKEGVEKIKKVLNYIKSQIDAEIKYITTPTYRVEVKTKNPKETEKKLKSILEKAVKLMEKEGGKASFSFID